MREKDTFITCKELKEKLQNREKMFIFDCSWELASNVGFSSWLKERISTSYFLNGELKLNGEFQDFLVGLGIQSVEEQIILYDSKGMWSVAKAFWMFLMLGFEKVKILQGGLPEWKALEFPLETTHKHHQEPIQKTHKEHFTLKREYLTEFQDLTSGQIIDLRLSARFNGIPGSEPRPNCPSGHIPGSLNIPYSQFLTKSGQFLLSKQELEEIFACKIGNHWKKEKLIFSCGSGITACIGFLAALTLGKEEKICVYAGSWIDYCQKSGNIK